MKRKFSLACYITVLVVSCVLASCGEFLGAKPDGALATPSTLKDLQALMDYEARFTLNYAPAGDIASDYYYLTSEDWAGRNDADRDTYIWHADTERLNDWNFSYEAIFISNVILDGIDQAALGQLSEADRSRVKGLAYFYRGWHFLTLSQLFTVPYDANTAESELGIPIRLGADINLPTKRATLKETFDRITADFRAAAFHLPAFTITPTRPSKAAAYAALARVMLIIRDWESSLRYADSCLQLNGTLMDYNDLDVHSNQPFDLFNQEVLLHTTNLSSSGVFSPLRAAVDSTLYGRYTDNDLRKTAYFFDRADGRVAFKGHYGGEGTGARSALLFSGLAIDEVYLIKAESLARLGRVDESLAALNFLLSNRYQQTSWQPFEASSVEECMSLVLDEREKSLPFRGGIRWSDLRRLNLEEQFAQKLVRVIDGKEHVLLPGDLRYAFLIPSEVVSLTGIVQNKR